MRPGRDRHAGRCGQGRRQCRAIGDVEARVAVDFPAVVDDPMCRIRAQAGTAGRVRIGPAPENLAIPPYSFLSDEKIKIG